MVDGDTRVLVTLHQPSAAAALGQRVRRPLEGWAYRATSMDIRGDLHCVPLERLGR
jgi:hypothetical protein